MRLDINSPRGRQSLKDEARAIELLEQRNPELFFAHTDKSRPCTTDGILIAKKQIVGVAEVKCRDMSAEKFFVDYKGEWLITKEKIDKACEVARRQGAPLVGMLYLTYDDMLYVAEISDKDGNIVLPHTVVDHIPTQKNCNTKNKVTKPNYLFDMNKAERFF